MSPCWTNLASSAAVRRPLGLLIFLPEQHEHLADALHRSGAGALAKRLKSDFARVAVEAGRPHFDQLVRRERAIDFLHHSIRKAFAADDDDGLQGMGPRFEQFTLGWCQNVTLAIKSFSPGCPSMVGKPLRRSHSRAARRLERDSPRRA